MINSKTTGIENNLDGPMIRGDVDLVGEELIINTRVAAAKALGWLMAAWPQEVTLIQLPF